MGWMAAAVAGSLLAAHSASTIEVPDDAMKGRTEAAIRDFRAAVELEPDPARGEKLYAACAECHSADGRGSSDGRAPAIAGQHVSVLVKQLVDFRHDRRWHEEMQNVAETHEIAGPQDMLDVAAYAASLPRWPPLAGGTGDGKQLELGKKAYHRQCASCHGPLGEGELLRMRPRVDGQHYRYLIRELEDTAAGRRPGMDEEHQARIRRLSSEQRMGLADYLSRLSPHLSSERERTPCDRVD
jgi:cytochrome c553